MRRRRIANGIAGLVAAVLAASAGTAQQQTGSLPALKHGQLVVWVVKAPLPRAGSPASAAAAPAGAPAGYQEQTAGSFGQSASNYGSSAGR